MRRIAGWVGRVPAFLVAVLALVFVVLTPSSLAVGGHSRPRSLVARRAAAVELPPTTVPVIVDPTPSPTPNAPGIVIASPATMDLPDPFLLDADKRYYLYLSTSFGDATNSDIPVSAGAVDDWGPFSDALPTPPTWARPRAKGTTVWSPDVVHLGSQYLMYFAPTLNNGSTQPTHCIGVAVSTAPAGPFLAVPGPPLVCQTALGGDIDPDFFTDPNGPDGADHPDYLIWKSDNNNLPGSGPTEIWAAPLANDGLSLTGDPVVIFLPTQPWEEPVLEAPQMVVSPYGQDWLFFSAGTGFFSSNYGVGVAECQGPLGGCHDIRSTPLLASNAQGAGPGEETIFVAPDHSTWMLYNPWHTAGSQPLRPVEAVRIGWYPAEPYIAEAGQFPSP